MQELIKILNVILQKRIKEEELKVSQENAKKSLTHALLEIQKLIDHAVKDSTNPHFNSDYESLESVIDTVIPTSNEFGVLVTQKILDDEKGYYIQTTLSHPETNQEDISKLKLIVGKNDMHGLTSAVTLGRRVALKCLFGIGKGHDDDGNAAIESHKKNKFDSDKTSSSKKVEHHNYTYHGPVTNHKNEAIETESFNKNSPTNAMTNASVSGANEINNIKPKIFGKVESATVQSVASNENNLTLKANDQHQRSALIYSLREQVDMARITKEAVGSMISSMIIGKDSPKDLTNEEMKLVIDRLKEINSYSNDNDTKP